MPNPLSKIIAVALCVCLIAQSAPAATDLWSERRQNASATLASARTTQAQPFNALVGAPIKPERLSSFSSHTKLQGLSPRASRVLSHLSAAHVRITEVDDSGPSQAPFLLLLQDVHLNREAQTHLASALQQLAENKAIPTIGVEGAFGPLDFSAFQAFPDQRAVASVADDLLADQQLAAPSHVGLAMGARAPRIVGVDDEIHYQKNVTAYLQARSRRTSLNRNVAALQALNERAQARVLSPALRELETLRLDFARGTITLGPYLERLTRLVPGPGPDIDRFIRAYRLERQLDFSLVERQRQTYLQALSETSSPDEMKRLFEAGVAHKAGRLSAADFYRALDEAGRANRVSMESVPAFQRYLDYVSLADAVNGERLFKAIERLEDAGLEQHTRTEAEREVLAASAQLVRLEKLSRFALTPFEWTRYQQGPRPLSRVADTLARHSGERAPAMTFVDLSPFESFYEEAHHRSRALVDNTLKEARGDAAALVIGGFHTPDITAMLREQGVPFAVGSPVLTAVDPGESGYLSIFDREKTPIEKLIADARLFINPASQNLGDPMTATLVRALAAERQPDTAVLPPATRVTRAGPGVFRLGGGFSFSRDSSLGGPDARPLVVRGRTIGVLFQDHDARPGLSSLWHRFMAWLWTLLPAAKTDTEDEEPRTPAPPEKPERWFAYAQVAARMKQIRDLPEAEGRPYRSRYSEFLDDADEFERATRAFLGVVEVDSSIDQQASSQYQASAELVANSIDAYVVQMGKAPFGRFGNGRNTVLWALKYVNDPSARVRLRTRAGDGPTRTLAYRNNRGRIEVSWTSQNDPEAIGTEVQVFFGDSEEEAGKRAAYLDGMVKELRGTFQQNRYVRIVLHQADGTSEVINDPSLLRDMDAAGARLSTYVYPGPTVDIYVEANGYRVVDRGPGITDDILLEKYLVPRSPNKDKSKSGDYKIFYDPGTGPKNQARTASVRALVNGRREVQLTPRGYNLADTLTVELPSSSWLPESHDKIRLLVNVDNPAEDEVHTLITRVLTSAIPDADKVQALNAMADLFQTVQTHTAANLRRSAKRATESWINDMHKKGYRFVPNERGFFFLDLPQNRMLFLDAYYYDFNPLLEIPGASFLPSKGKGTFYEVDFINTSAKSFSYDNETVTFVNRRTYAPHRAHPAPVNVHLSAATGYRDDGRRPGQLLPQTADGGTGSSAEGPVIDDTALSAQQKDDLNRLRRALDHDSAALWSERVKRLWEMTIETRLIADPELLLFPALNAPAMAPGPDAIRGIELFTRVENASSKFFKGKLYRRISAMDGAYNRAGSTVIVFDGEHSYYLDLGEFAGVDFEPFVIYDDELYLAVVDTAGNHRMGKVQGERVIPISDEELKKIPPVNALTHDNVSLLTEKTGLSLSELHDRFSNLHSYAHQVGEAIVFSMAPPGSHVNHLAVMHNGKVTTITDPHLGHVTYVDFDGELLHLVGLKDPDSVESEPSVVSVLAKLNVTESGDIQYESVEIDPGAKRVRAVNTAACVQTQGTHLMVHGYTQADTGVWHHRKRTYEKAKLFGEQSPAPGTLSLQGALRRAASLDGLAPALKKFLQRNSDFLNNSDNSFYTEQLLERLLYSADRGVEWNDETLTLMALFPASLWDKLSGENMERLIPFIRKHDLVELESFFQILDLMNNFIRKKDTLSQFLSNWADIYAVLNDRDSLRGFVGTLGRLPSPLINKLENLTEEDAVGDESTRLFLQYLRGEVDDILEVRNDEPVADINGHRVLDSLSSDVPLARLYVAFYQQLKSEDDATRLTKSGLQEVGSLSALQTELDRYADYDLAMARNEIRSSRDGQDQSDHVPMRELVQNALDIHDETYDNLPADERPAVEVDSFLRTIGDRNEWVRRVRDRGGMNLATLLGPLLIADFSGKKGQNKAGEHGQGFLSLLGDYDKIQVKTSLGGRTFVLHLERRPDSEPDDLPVITRFVETDEAFEGTVIEWVKLYDRQPPYLEALLMGLDLIRYVGAVAYNEIRLNGRRINEAFEMKVSVPIRWGSTSNEEGTLTLFYNPNSSIKRETIRGLQFRPLQRETLASVPPALQLFVSGRGLTLEFPEKMKTTRTRTGFANYQVYQKAIERSVAAGIYKLAVMLYPTLHRLPPGMTDEFFSALPGNAAEAGRLDPDGLVPDGVIEDAERINNGRIEDVDFSRYYFAAGDQTPEQESRRAADLADLLSLLNVFDGDQPNLWEIRRALLQGRDVDLSRFHPSFAQEVERSLGRVEMRSDPGTRILVSEDEINASSQLSFLMLFYRTVLDQFPATRRLPLNFYYQAGYNPLYYSNGAIYINLANEGRNALLNLSRLLNNESADADDFFNRVLDTLSHELAHHFESRRDEGLSHTHVAQKATIDDEAVVPHWIGEQARAPLHGTHGYFISELSGEYLDALDTGSWPSLINRLRSVYPNGPDKDDPIFLNLEKRSAPDTLDGVQTLGLGNWAGVWLALENGVRQLMGVRPARLDHLPDLVVRATLFGALEGALALALGHATGNTVIASVIWAGANLILHAAGIWSYDTRTGRVGVMGLFDAWKSRSGRKGFWAANGVAVFTGVLGILLIQNGAYGGAVLTAVSHAAINALLAWRISHMRKNQARAEADSFMALMEAINTDQWGLALQLLNRAESLGLSEVRTRTAPGHGAWDALWRDPNTTRALQQQLNERGLDAETLETMLNRIEQLRGKDIVLYFDGESAARVAETVTSLLRFGVNVNVVMNGPIPAELGTRFAGKRVTFADARGSGLLVRGKTKTVDSIALKNHFGWDPANLILAVPAGVTVIHSGVAPTVIDLEALVPMIRLISNETLIEAVRRALTAA